ncbi:ABC transporter substrate-binding protein [Rhodopila sp.]|uniref:ABC transporter substrate-binding protein n=1 Tax=Rhodopila sp. TaxID=2480087 RepID=UPI002BB4FF6F|nr:ABC transporter substrate-binding protein [Rhodopila sp.]HVZ07695.1 ABC transporter substrate-binding protein [Rhodopila sp.]
MRRRTLLTAAGAIAAGSLAAPRLSRAADSKVLKFVPQANLANLDPIWTTQYVVRNGSLLIWDMLLGVDDQLRPQPQMVESYEASPDFKVWTFKLRPGLKFHDGEPVRARDAVASINRWMARDAPMGVPIKKRIDALEAVDDRTFRFRLSQPYPKMLFALGKSSTPCLFVMPERIAATDPFKQITEYVGSGPMRFRQDEWVPGAKAVFEKFDGYVPRTEKANWLSGGKRINFDRIEWQIIPDGATAAGALQNGEVDWVETPVTDLVPSLRQNPAIAVDIADPLGNIGSFRINHLYPPFNDERVRRAVQIALSQEDYMGAVIGSDESLWKTLPSFFTPGTPLYTENGGDPLKGRRDYDGAKQLLAEAGYKNEPIILLVATDVAITKAQGDVTADLLKRIGMNVQYQALDWGTVGQRRASKEPPDKGGWHIFHTWHAGADCVNPAPYTALDASGPTAWFGWPKSDLVQEKIAAWYAAPDLAAEKVAIAELNKAAMDFVVYIPTGWFKFYQAWRTSLSGVTKAPFPVFWDVTKA